jgi:hypothetical protein
VQAPPYTASPWGLPSRTASPRVSWPDRLPCPVQDLTLDLWEVGLYFEYLLANVDCLHIPLGLEIIEGQLEAHRRIPLVIKVPCLLVHLRFINSGRVSSGFGGDDAL